MAVRFLNLGEMDVTIPRDWNWKNEVLKKHSALFLDGWNYIMSASEVRAVVDKFPTQRFMPGASFRAKLHRPESKEPVHYEEILAFARREKLILHGIEGLFLVWSLLHNKNKLPYINLYGIDEVEKLPLWEDGKHFVPAIQQYQGYCSHPRYGSVWTEHVYREGAVLTFEKMK